MLSVLMNYLSIEILYVSHHKFKSYNIIKLENDFTYDTKIYNVRYNESSIEVLENELVFADINFDIDIQEIIFKIFSAMSEIFTSDCKIIITLDNRQTSSKTRSQHVFEILKCLPYLDSKVVKLLNSHKNDVETRKVPILLCFVRLLEFLFNLDQSDETGILHNMLEKKFGFNLFNEFINSDIPLSEIIEWMFGILILKENYVLFEHKNLDLEEPGILNELHKIFESKINSREKCLKIVKTIYKLNEYSSNIKYLNLNVDRIRNIKISDNLKLINFIKEKSFDEKIHISTKDQRIFIDSVVKKEECFIFIQSMCSIIANVDPVYNMICLLQAIDNFDDELNYAKFKEKALQYFTAEDLLKITAFRSKSGRFKFVPDRFHTKFKEMYADIVANMSMTTFIKAYRMFTRLFYYKIDTQDEFLSHIEQMFFENNCVHQLIYRHILQMSIFPIFPVKNDEFICDKSNGVLINAKKMKLNFAKKARFFKDRGFSFYLGTECFKVHNVIYKSLITKNIDEYLNNLYNFDNLENICSFKFDEINFKTFLDKSREYKYIFETPTFKIVFDTLLKSIIDSQQLENPDFKDEKVCTINHLY